MTTLGFWLVTAAVMLLGVYLFKKLRPHFADVL
jgi:ABC-type polysaccharide/polyol phosphate export permease